jgi:hypothetical protein
MAELSITNFGIGAGFGGGGNPPSTGNMGLSLGGFNQVNNSIQNQSLGSMSFINPNFDFSPTTQPSMGGSIQIGNIGGATQIDNLNLLKPPTFTFPSLTIPPPPKPVIYEPPVETTPISAFSTEFADRGLNAVSQLKTFKGDIQFIVSFSDGNYYTSPSYKKKLKEAERRGDKYLTIKTAKLVTLNGPELGVYYNKNKFRVGELYSEVAVTKTIRSAEEMLIHIDWLCTQGKFFRNTQVEQSIEAKGKTIAGIGSWMVNHDKEGNFALEFKDQFDRVQEDKAFAEEQYGGPQSIGESAQQVLRPSSVQAVTYTAPTPPPEVASTSVPPYPPFGTPGTAGEQRIHEGFVYFFNPPQDKWRREDSLLLSDKELALEYTNPTAFATYQNTEYSGDDELIRRENDLNQIFQLR